MGRWNRVRYYLFPLSPKVFEGTRYLKKKYFEILVYNNFFLFEKNSILLKKNLTFLRIFLREFLDALSGQVEYHINILRSILLGKTQERLFFLFLRTKRFFLYFGPFHVGDKPITGAS